MDGYLGQPRGDRRRAARRLARHRRPRLPLDGELYLTGRAKDILLLRGRNHAPEEVERAVENVAGVRTGCVVAVTWLPEGADTERLLVLVEARRDFPAAGYDALAGPVSDAVLASLGLIADTVLILSPGTLPRTSSGKLRRQEALRLFLSGALTPPDRVTPLAVAAAVARSSMAFLRARWAR